MADEQRRKAKRTALAVLAVHVVIVGLAAFFLTQARVAAPSPDVRGFHSLSPTERQARSCRSVLSTDDLVHLPLRRPRALAVRQLARWDACDKKRLGPAKAHHTRSVARTALGWDRAFIATAGIGFLLAFVRLVRVPAGRTPRWRLAGYAGGLLALAYLAFDSLENIWLADFIGSPATHWVPNWSGWLPWISAAKFGAFLGALPVFLISVATAIGDYSIARSDDAWKDRQRLLADADNWQDQVRAARRGRTKRFGRRLMARLRPPAPALTPERREPPLAGKGADLGICCSGGGIRSAAFNLGALQALEGDPDGARPHPGEVTRARWLSSSTATQPWRRASSPLPRAPRRASPPGSRPWRRR